MSTIKDTLIKQAVNRDSSGFVNLIKNVLSEQFISRIKSLKKEVASNLTEAIDNPLSIYGISKYKNGTDYSSSGPKSFVVNNDDIANDIEKSLKSKKVGYVRTSLNFTIV